MKKLFILAACVSWLCAAVAQAQTGTTAAPVWTYTLVGPSTLVVDCPPCMRPSIPEALRGSFQLRLLSSNAQAQVYAVQNVDFHTGDPESGFGRRLVGSGQYRILNRGTETPKQELFLELSVTVAGVVTNKTMEFTNDLSAIRRPFPLLELWLTDTLGDPYEIYHLNLLAAPAREIWFSTTHNFSSGRGVSGTRGDLLSHRGKIVRRHGELIGRLGLMPMLGEYNVDAFDVAPGGELQFSLDQDVFSETKGPMHHGDLLSSRGHVVKTFAQLLAPFSIMPPTPDAGLDAVARLPDGTLVFSVREGYFSQALGRFIRPGDLLSENGQIYRTVEQLLAAFHTREAGEVGLDAVYVWPHGEIWFSTENGFQDEVLGPIQAGDLLSSYGYVVFRNLDLLNPFQPLEDLADFGLDGLYVVTDTLPSQAPPRLTAIQLDRHSGTLSLEWNGAGGVFQLEWAPSINGPWQPVPDLVPDATTILNLPTNLPPMRFYRLLQW